MVLILNLFMFGWSLISQATFVYFVMFLYAALVLVSIGITRHITLLDDSFFIRQELLMEFRAFASMFVVGGVLIVFGPAMGWTLCGFLLIELSVACILCMCFIATYYVTKQCFIAGLDSVNGPIEVGLASSAPPLAIALADSKATTEFIRHLVNEVSVENIFFLSDIMAYKRTFVDTQKLSSMGNGFECAVATNLARLIYRRTFTHYAWAIAKTYVDGSSSLYVTAISDEVRQRICDSLETKDPSIELSDDEKESEELLQELLCVFDEAANEVYDQLKRSYARFGYSEQFAKVAKNFGGDKMLLIPNQTA